MTTLIQRLQDCDVHDDAAFGAVVAEAIDWLGIAHQRKLMVQFELTVPGIRRWAAGQAAPYPKLRPKVIAWLLKRVQDEVEMGELP